LAITIFHAVAVFLTLVIVFWLQARPLIKSGQRRELIAFSIFMLFAAALSITLIMGVRLPNPADLYFKLSGFFIRWLLKGSDIEGDIF